MQVLIKTITPLLAVSLLLGSCTDDKKQEKQETAPVKVTVYLIGKATQTQKLNYSGTIEPDNTARIGFAVGGVINNVLVQEGQRVRQGQLLATIDATEYINSLAIAESGLEQAEDLYKRLNELYQKGSLPAKDYIEIKTKVAQARSNKNISAKRIADSRLYAPMSGIITTRSIERGSMAAPGIVAFTIIKTDQVYARFSVPESEVGAIKTGMTGRVYIPTLSDTVVGKVSIINPQADAISRTYSVKIRLANPGQQLLPGMLTETKIMTNKTVQAIVVPAKAVLRDADELSFVYVVNEVRKAVKKRVTTGNLTGASEVIIKEGLRSGEQVIIAGQSALKDGSAVSF